MSNALGTAKCELQWKNSLYLLFFTLVHEEYKYVVYVVYRKLGAT